MAINTIALAEKMTGELDKAVVQKAQTGFFADNALRTKFVGAGTVIIPDLDMNGLGDYDRDAGFAQGAMTVKHNSYTLSMDRGRTFQLDAQDEDESGIPGFAGQVMGEFVRTKVVPEMDAYVLSKIATYATGKSQTVTGTPASQAYAMFTEALGKAQNAIGYDEEMVAFLDSTMWAAFQKTTEISRSITVSDFRKGDVDLKVKSINGVPLFPVSDSRMKDSFTFYDGKTAGGEDAADQRPGGFVPAESAKNVGLIVMPKRAVSLVKKTEKVRVFSPDKNLNADAWKFDYRLYYDAFVRNSLGGGVFAYTYTAS